MRMPVPLGKLNGKLLPTDRQHGDDPLPIARYVWRESAYASLLQFSQPILNYISAIKTKLGTEL